MAPVIVCSCRAVSDRTLRDLLARGLSPGEALRTTGAGSDCGCCAEALGTALAVAAPCRDVPCADCPRATARAA